MNFPPKSDTANTIYADTAQLKQLAVTLLCHQAGGQELNRLLDRKIIKFAPQACSSISKNPIHCDREQKLNMASPLIPGSSTKSTKPSSGEAKVQSGKTKRGGGLNDSDGWAEYNGYMNAKKSKLNEQFNHEKKGQDSNIFSGVAIYVNGYTNPSSDELRRILQQNGGRYEMYLSMTHVTHVVATNLPNSKYHLAKRIPVVYPAWITDSLAAGKRLPHVPYLLLGNKPKLQPSLKAAPSVSSGTHKMSTLPTQYSPLSLQKEELKHTDIEQDVKQYVPSHHLSIKADTEHPGIHSFPGEISETPFPNLTDGINSRTRKPFCAKNHGTIFCPGKKQVDDNDAAVKHDNDVDVAVKDDNDDDVSVKDDSDDDIVYNSEEDENSKKDVTKSTNTLLFHHDVSPNKLRSRVYSLRAIRKSSLFSIGAPGSDGTNRCDGFIDCPMLDSLDCNEGLNKRVKRSSLPDHVIVVGSSRFSSNHSPAVSSDLSPNTSLEESKSNLADRSLPVPVSSSLICPKGQLAPLVPECSTTRYSEFDVVSSNSSNIHQSTTSSSEISNPESRSSSVSSPLIIKQPHIPRSNPLSSNKECEQSQTLTTSAASSVQTPEIPPTSLKQTLQPLSASSTMAKAGDKNFLNEFYSNSRLHHIATWGSGFKAYVSEIQKSHDHSYPGREKLRQAHVQNALKENQAETLSSARLEATKKTVMHIDMDCFFVSVGLLARPELKGKPVAVTHSRGQGPRPNPDSNQTWERSEWMKKRNGKLKGSKPKVVEDVDMDDTLETSRNASSDKLLTDSTGAHSFHSMAEIASCSYEARKAGVKNGMFMGSALKLCPNLQTIPYVFDEYNRVSKVLYDLVASYTHDIEAVSCDEMLVDCSEVLADTGATAMEFAQVLRAEMLETTGCSASAGIGPNILLARLATRRAKPNGQFEVSVDEARNFIKDQPVSDLPGVGYSMSRKLALLGVHSCGDLQKIPLSTLKQEFGPKTGEMLHAFCVGHDSRNIQGNKQRKSVSAEVNYGIRFTKEPEAVTFLQGLSLEVKKRMDAIGVKGRSITLKLMVRRPDAPLETAKFMGHGICNTFNKSSNLPLATNDDKIIAREVVSLYRAQRIVASDVRGIGIQMNKLERTGTLKENASINQTSGHQSILHFAVPKTQSSAITTITTNADLVSIAESAVPSSEYRPGTKTLTGHASSRHSSVSASAESLASGKSVKGESVNPLKSARKDSIEPTTSLKSINKESFNNLHWENSKTSITDNPAMSPKCSSPSQRLGPADKGSTGQPVGLPQTCSHSQEAEVNSDLDAIALYDICDHNTSVVPTNFNQDRVLGIPGLNYNIPSTSRQSGDDSFSGFLTESQIDNDVLQELPREIAQEILEDLRNRKLNKQASSISPGLLARDIRGSGLHVEGSSKRGIDAALDEGLPSLSQLDLTCFSALPLYLQDELRTAYVKQEVTSRPAAEKGDNFTRLKSPSKDKRGKQPKSRRGRAVGKKLLTFGSSKIKDGSSDNRSLKGNNERTSGPCSDIIICDDDSHDSRDRYTDDNSNDVTRVRSATDHSAGDGGKEPLEDLVFCGARRLEDVRALMKEWLLSCPVPLDNDVAMVTEYLVKLVELRNLEQAFCLLKFLAR